MATPPITAITATTATTHTGTERRDRGGGLGAGLSPPCTGGARGGLAGGAPPMLISARIGGWLSRNDPMPAVPDTGGGRGRTAAVVLAVVVGLTLGVGLTLALTGGDDSSTTAPLDATDPSVPTTAPNSGAPPPGAVAGSPEAAVEGFLAAEIAGDLDASFGFLSAEAWSRFGSPASWTASHADLLAPIRAYEVEEVDESEVITLVTFEPGLDEVKGLVAERTRVVWTTSADGGSWGSISPPARGSPCTPPTSRRPPR